MDEKGILKNWLKDAYAMENQLIQVLEEQSDQSKDYPDIQAKVDEHLQKTKGHAQMMEQCLEGLGESTSTVKSGISSAVGNVTGMGAGMSDTTLHKNAISDFAAENFEIATYSALIDAANECGQTRIAQVCKQILQDEQEMAQWLTSNLPKVVMMELRTTAGTPA